MLEALRASLRTAPTLEAAEAIENEIAALEAAQAAPGAPVEGNRSRPTAEGLSEALTAIKAGADFTAVVIELAPLILAGNVAESIARSTLCAAYGQPDGDDLFTAAMMEAAAEPVQIPILTHHDPLRSADAFLELVHSSNGIRLLHRHQGDFFRWVGTHYARFDRPLVRGQVWRFLPKGRLKPKTDRVSNVLDAVESQVHLPDESKAPFWLSEVSDPDYPDPVSLIPLRSGLLDPDSGRLYPPTPRLFYRMALPFDYDPADDTPPVEWLRFLDTVWGKDAEDDGYLNDPQSIDCLQEIMGYCLTQDTTQEKMFLLVGDKRSGKGTIARILEGLLGEGNVASSSFDEISTGFGLQELPGKPLLLFPDAMVTAKTDVMKAAETLKKISGRDPVRVNGKYRDPYSVRLNIRVVMMANIVPRLMDASNALSSRFIVLKLTRSFLGKEDLGLQSRLLPELPRILHWALAGLRRLRRRGWFEQPDSAKDVVTELAEQSSPMRAFLTERCELGSSREVPRDRLWAMWQQWSQSRNEQPGQLNWFVRDLRAALPTLAVKDRRRADGQRSIVLRGVSERVDWGG